MRAPRHRPRLRAPFITPGENLFTRKDRKKGRARASHSRPSTPHDGGEDFFASLNLRFRAQARAPSVAAILSQWFGSWVCRVAPEKAKGLNHMRRDSTTTSTSHFKRAHQKPHQPVRGASFTSSSEAKLFDDYHASRIAPRFEPDSKFRMPWSTRSEIIIAMTRTTSRESKTRGDLGITYDEEVLRLLDVFRSRGFATSGVVITHFENQPSAVAFRSRLDGLGIEAICTTPLPGTPTTPRASSPTRATAKTSSWKRRTRSSW